MSIEPEQTEPQGEPQPQPQKRKMGFANLTPEQRKEMARMGGKAVSKNRYYMSQIGQVGGLKKRKKKDGND